MNASLDVPPFAVLKHFAPHTSGLMWRRVPGGFSGASVWRGDEREAPRLALKAWPPGTSPERVLRIHEWLARAQHLSFVPPVAAGAGGQTVCAEAGRVWDCCRWMPGAPRDSLSAAEAAAACEAVAQLHDAWAGETQRGACPGVLNRLRALRENEPLLQARSGALPPVAPQLDELLRRAVTVAARLAPLAVQALRPWEQREFTLQPCVRDLRAEHVLFEGDRVGGVIDFGAAAFDHPAVDLARFLDDAGCSDAARFAAGVNAYRSARPAFDAPDDFVLLLARTGAVCSVIGWLVRLAVRREKPADPAAAASRLALLLSRLLLVPHF